MTQPAIVSGSVPGSTSRLATFVTSIAICSRVLLATSGERCSASLSGSALADPGRRRLAGERGRDRPQSSAGLLGAHRLRNRLGLALRNRLGVALRRALGACGEATAQQQP